MFKLLHTVRTYCTTLGLVGAFFTSSHSLADVRVELSRGKGTSKSSVDWPVTHSWEWTTNEENVRTLASRLVLSLPQEGLEATAVPRTTRVKVDKSKLRLQMRGLFSRIELSGGPGPQTIDVRVRPLSGQIIDDNCEKNLVRLYPDDKNFPFYLGTSCGGERGKSVSLTLTFPREVELEQSTLFEAKGKGELWRHYEVGNIKAASGEIGRITFKYKQKSYYFSFESLRVESGKEKNEQASRIGIGLNFSQLSIKGDDINASDAKPGLSLHIPAYPIWQSLGLGLDFDTTLSAGEAGSNSVSYTQFQFFASYEVAFQRFKFSPRGYFIFTDSQNSATRVNFKQSQLAPGVYFAFRVYPQLDLEIDSFIASLGSKTVKSHFQIGLSLRWINPNERGLSWGGGLKAQSYLTDSSTGSQRDFSQTIAYGMLIF
jgi:hypothetical protein